MWKAGTKKRGAIGPPFHNYCSTCLYEDVVELLLEDCRATTIAAIAAAAKATVVDTAVAAPAAPADAADDPAAPELPDADPDDEFD